MKREISFKVGDECMCQSFIVPEGNQEGTEQGGICKVTENPFLGISPYVTVLFPNGFNTIVKSCELSKIQ